MTKLIILDRDGVINEDSDEYVKSVDEWFAIAGSLEAIAQLNSAGYTVAIATNQSGIGRGLFTLEDFEEMCEKMDILLDQVGGHIDGVFFCPCHPDENCDCRKPETGMLEDIQNVFELDNLNGVPFVGDSLRDLQAGKAMNCQPILVRTGKGEKTEQSPVPEGTQVFDSLADYVDNLLGA